MISIHVIVPLIFTTRAYQGTVINWKCFQILILFFSKKKKKNTITLKERLGLFCKKLEQNTILQIMWRGYRMSESNNIWQLIFYRKKDKGIDKENG